MSEETGHTHERCVFCEASDAAGRLFRAFGPSEKVAGHFRQSRIEFLKGIRTMLDQKIEHLGQTHQKGTRVVVE